MSLSDFPALNACLNTACTLFLLAGYLFIKRGNIPAHRISMTAAFITSAIFLTSYLYYHAHAGSKAYAGTGILRTIYFSILISHSVLAAAIVPLVLTTVVFAWRGRFDRHRRIARWTWPLWMYVSVTGVVIYAMLYQ